MAAKTLMALGVSLSVCKTLLVTALCCIYAGCGWKTAPFKARDMSNNAAMCQGGEIGCAQTAQACVADLELAMEMNPILLKPEVDSHSQVIVLGRRSGE